MMMTINFGASKREEPEDNDTDQHAKQLKKEALKRRMKGFKNLDPDEKKKTTMQASTFGGKK